MFHVLRRVLAWVVRAPKWRLKETRGNRGEWLRSISPTRATEWLWWLAHLNQLIVAAGDFLTGSPRASVTCEACRLCGIHGTKTAAADLRSRFSDRHLAASLIFAGKLPGRQLDLIVSLHPCADPHDGFGGFDPGRRSSREASGCTTLPPQREQELDGLLMQLAIHSLAVSQFPEDILPASPAACRRAPRRANFKGSVELPIVGLASFRLYQNPWPPRHGSDPIRTRWRGSQHDFRSLGGPLSRASRVRSNFSPRFGPSKHTRWGPD